MDLASLFVISLVFNSNIFYPLDLSNPTIIPTQVWELYHASASLKIYDATQANGFEEAFFLKNAWSNARKAKEISSQLKDDVFSYYIYLFSPKTFSQFTPFYQKYKQAEAYYRMSIGNASMVFSLLRNRFAEDMQTLDLIGVDKTNSTARAFFEEGKRVIEAFRGAISSSCSSNKLSFKTACALNSLKSKEKLPIFYNSVVSLDNNSLLFLFKNFHDKTNEIKKDMENRCLKLKEKSIEQINKANKLLQWLDRQEAFMVSPADEARFLKSSGREVTMGDAFSFQNLIYDARRRILKLKEEVIKVNDVFERKADDYLLETIIKLSGVSSEAKMLTYNLERAKDKLKNVNGNAKQEALLKRQENEKESFFTKKADYFIKKAEEAPLGLSVVYYSKALDFLEVIHEEEEFLKMLTNADKILRELKKLGVNIRAEEEKLEKLKKPGLNEFDMFLAESDLLLSSVKLKAMPFKEKVEKERKEIKNMFKVIDELSKLPFFEKPDNMLREKFEASLVDDDFETLYEDIKLYEEIKNKLTRTIKPFVNKLLEDKIRQELIIPRARCNEEITTVEKVIISNPFDITLENISITIKPFGEIAEQFEGKKFIKIKILKPREIKEFEINSSLVPVVCSAQHDERTGNVITSIRKIEVFYPADSIEVVFKKPFENASVMRTQFPAIDKKEEVVINAPPANGSVFVTFFNNSLSLPVPLNHNESILMKEDAVQNQSSILTNISHDNNSYYEEEKTTVEKQVLLEEANSTVSLLEEKARQELEFAKNHYYSREMLEKAADAFEKGNYLDSIYYSRKSTEQNKPNYFPFILLFFSSLTIFFFILLKKPKKKPPRRVMSYSFPE